MRLQSQSLPETRLAVPSDQDVALDIPSVNMGLTHFFVLPTGVMHRVKYPTHEDASGRGTLAQAIVECSQRGYPNRSSS
jgi:hypothetical protein